MICFMAYKCDYCGKRTMHGNMVSHAKNRVKRIFRPNLHPAKIVIDGVKTRLRLCTRCIRTLKKNQSAAAV